MSSSTSTEQPPVNPIPSESGEAVAASTPIRKPTPEQVAQQVMDSHELRVFHPAKRSVNVRNIMLPESFFEPSPSELTTVLQTYSEQAERMQNGTMKTRKMRQAETEERMKRFRKVLVRVQLPDRVSLQGVFTPQTTIRQVVRFVRAALKDARNVKFHLFVVPPKRMLARMDATLWEEGMVPAAIVYLGLDSCEVGSMELLKEVVMVKITDVPVAESTVGSVNAACTDRASSDKSAGEVLPEGSLSKRADGSAKPAKTRKVPKWFKK